MYIKLSDQSYPVSLRVIKAEYPSTSFPANPTDDQLAPYGYANVFETTPPAYNTDTHKLEEDAPNNDGSQWNQVWIAIALTQTEMDANLQRARDKKYLESEAHADSLISAAYANPTDGVTENPSTYKKMVNARERDKANKVAGEITLDQTEKDVAKVDQKLSEYDGKTWIANDKCYTNIDKKDFVSEVEAIDILTIVVWPVWTPV